MGSYLDWKVGDRVVCLASVSPAAAIKGANYPEKDGVYTIREIRDDNLADTQLVLLLVEVDNRHFIGVQVGDKYGYKEPGFPIHAFRKVQPRKTDIAVFEAILNGTRVPEDA